MWVIILIFIGIFVVSILSKSKSNSRSHDSLSDTTNFVQQQQFMTNMSQNNSLISEHHMHDNCDCSSNYDSNCSSSDCSSGCDSCNN